MKNVLLSLACLLCILGNAQDAATTVSSINLRASHDKTSKAIIVIPQGTRIYTDNCEGDWCQTKYHGQTGYVNKNYLRYTNPQPVEVKTTQPKALSPIHHYTNVDGNKVQSPTQYDAIPAGASAQCYDGSYSFSQHRRGTCSHHGGVKRWL